MSSLDHVSEKASIEDEYPNFDDNFNIDLLPGLEDEDDGYGVSLNYYWSEYDYENNSFLIPIHTLTIDKYILWRQINDEAEVNIEVNSAATYDAITITNNH